MMNPNFKMLNPRSTGIEKWSLPHQYTGDLWSEFLDCNNPSCLVSMNDKNLKPWNDGTQTEWMCNAKFKLILSVEDGKPFVTHKMKGCHCHNFIPTTAQLSPDPRIIRYVQELYFKMNLKPAAIASTLCTSTFYGNRINLPYDSSIDFDNTEISRLVRSKKHQALGTYQESWSNVRSIL